jgi:hypothetical protein
MPFPTIPDDLFDEFDWSAFHALVVAQQIDLVNSLTDEKLDALGRLVDGYEASNERTRRVLQVVHAILGLGLKVLLA